MNIVYPIDRQRIVARAVGCALICLGLVFLFSQQSLADGEIVSEGVGSIPSSVESRWSAEADIQAHSVAGQGSPWVGVAAAYKLSETFQLGLRGFMPASRPVDESTYSAQLFGRWRFRRGQKTDLFLEPEVAENFYHFAPWPSAGLAVGALNRFSPGLGFGVIGGIECAHFVLDSMGIEERTDLIVYPKVSLIANFIF